MKFWRRNRQFSDLERELRADRPKPSKELVQRVRDEAGPAASERPVFRPRVALVGTLSAAALAVVVALGGASYPVDAGLAILKFDTAGKNDKGNAKKTDATDDQYGDKVTICHRPPGNPSNGQTLRVSEQGAEGHFRNHPNDSAGPCS